MKNLFLACVTVFCLSSFTSVYPNAVLMHDCTYNMYNASGQYLGQQTISIFDGMSCGSSSAKSIAIDVYNHFH